MLSKNRVKKITSLHQKKYRREENQFIAEGEKVVFELLSSGWGISAVYGTQEFFNRMPGKVRIPKRAEVVLVTENELKKISALSTPQYVLAVAEIPSGENAINYESGLKLLLDGISDPGNLGTIIRIADWFGVSEIICSENTADCFNPKVVQASMGSLFHLKLHYENLIEVLKENLSRKNLPVYGTVLDGEDIHKQKFTGDSFIIAGNESSGISYELLSFITNKITIPSFNSSKAESLNVAVATGIVLSEFRRN
jgi:RNA methyltransferase, TrmH family